MKKQLTSTQHINIIYAKLQKTRDLWPNIKNEEIIESGKCLALKEQIAILVDGTVVPCCLDNNGDIPLGNIFEKTLEEIGSIYNVSRERVRQIEVEAIKKLRKFDEIQEFKNFLN